MSPKHGDNGTGSFNGENRVVVCWWMDLMILKVFSDPSESMLDLENKSDVKAVLQITVSRKKIWVQKVGEQIHGRKIQGTVSTEMLPLTQKVHEP